MPVHDAPDNERPNQTAHREDGGDGKPFQVARLVVEEWGYQIDPNHPADKEPTQHIHISLKKRG